jgi:hypothetical protein
LNGDERNKEICNKIAIKHAQIRNQYTPATGIYNWSHIDKARLYGLVVRVPGYRSRHPGLPDFLRSGGSGTGSTQPSEDN